MCWSLGGGNLWLKMTILGLRTRPISFENKKWPSFYPQKAHGLPTRLISFDPRNLLLAWLAREISHVKSRIGASHPV